MGQKPRKRMPTNDGPRQFMTDVMARIKAERKRRGMTQAELASLVGVTQNRIAAYETDPLSVTALRLYHLCAVLGIELLVRPRHPANEHQKDRP